MLETVPRALLACSGLALIVLLVAGCPRTPQASAGAAPVPPERLTRAEAEEDLRQLLGLLESAHPDPYGARGKVAFHRAFQGLLASIPPDGLSATELLGLARPFVASLRDGHTTIGPGQRAGDGTRAWLDLEPVAGALVVSRVYREQDRPLLGGVLVSLDGVGAEALQERAARLRGAENGMAELLLVARSLADAGWLRDLLAWVQVPSTLEVVVRVRGEVLRADLPIGELPAAEGIEPPSALDLPEVDAGDMAWAFLAEDRSVAWLRFASMMRYREAFEIWRDAGYVSNLGEHLAETAGRAAGGPLPDDVDARIALVPSAAEQLALLCAAMEDAGTRHLVVDLRDNAGGQSYVSLLLAVFLYGLDPLVDVDDGYQVRRYSRLWLDNYTSESEETLASRGLVLGDYDFGEQLRWQRRRREGLSEVERAERRATMESWLLMAPTARRVLGEGSRDARYAPPRVTVLTSAGSASAAFDAAVLLKKLGASLAGVPSSQAGNCFIDSLGYRLDHSGLGGSISYKQSLLFPDDLERGRLLRPDLELTLDALDEMHGDPNAIIRLVLEGELR